MSVNNEDRLPPMSQSHFSKFDNFTPDDDASFDHEFARLASSQSWVPGSQIYTQERTIAMRQELKLHYFSSQLPPLGDVDEDLTEEEKLEGYQDPCREVRIPPSDSIAECKKQLKNMLVNIVDLIDARRMSKEVKIWHNFEAFREYTLQDEHRVSMDEAKKDGGYLASLLQRLREPKSCRRKVKRRDGRGPGVISGRVLKKRPLLDKLCVDLPAQITAELSASADGKTQEWDERNFRSQANHTSGDLARWHLGESVAIRSCVFLLTVAPARWTGAGKAA